MTNFEHMKQKIVNTVMGLDEMELLRLADDTEMSTSGAEGVFNCTVCEEEFGECGTCSCTNEYNRKYLEWCKKEHISGDKVCKAEKGQYEECIEISRK